MKKMIIRITAFVLCAAMLFALSSCGKKKSDDPLEQAAFDAMDYLCGKNDITSGSEWVALAAASWENLAPKKTWQEAYGKSVAEAAKECDGVFGTRKMTDQAKVVIGVTAAGFDASAFEGFNLNLPMADYDKTLKQGINGAAWSLIALEYGGYDMAENSSVETQATNDMYIDYILSRQLPDGGFAFASNATKGDPDMTGMVLIALANYTDRKNVKTAVEGALSCMAQLQNEDGGFSSYGEETAESCAQMIMAFNKLGISLNDERFVKNGRTIMDKLLEYQNEDGGFSHIIGEETNGVATAQSLLAIISCLRLASGMPEIFTINR